MKRNKAQSYFGAIFLALLLVIIPSISFAGMEDYPAVKLRALDKSTARTSTIEVVVGQTYQFGSLFIKPQACRRSDPLEKPETTSFLQVWEVPINAKKSEWIFSGWMFASSPALSAMDHAVYDVWILDCLMDGKQIPEANKEEKTESTPSQANIPTFPIPEERPKQDLTNNKPITSSITNEDGSIDIKKIFGGDDLPSDEALQKENPLIGSEILSVDNKSDAEKFKEQGAQSLDELIKKTSNSESGTSEPKKEEELKINFEGKTEPQVFGDEKKTDEPDLSDNLPWLKKETESSRSEENTDSKISPTFIIEKRQKKSAWRWIFPLVFVILIIAVIFLVPNNSIKIEDIAFWKNWEKISLFERKDKDKLDEKEQVIAENQDQDKGEKDTSSKKIENVFMKLKNMNNQENVDTKITEDKVKSNEIKTITQSSSDESYLIHIVQPGNTLWGLSNYYYKRSSLWPNIYRKNIEILPTPDFLPLGRKLLIPELRGESYHLSKADSARIAQGYYLAYTAYKKYDENKAKGYLEMSKKFGTTIK